MRTRFLVAGLALVAALALSACGGEPPDPDAGARPVTTEEAQLLAVARFNNFDAGTRPVRSSVTEQGTALALQGWFDYASHVGYAAVTGEFDPQSLLWTASAAGIADAAPDAEGNPPLPIPVSLTSGESRGLDPTSSRLDALLAVIGSLGSDRPDNPLLLQQTGALWLREDTIDSTAVTVFAAPPSDTPPDASSPPITADTSSLRLWVDAAGLMRRAEVRLGSDWTTIEMPDAAGPVLTLPTGDGS